MRRARLATAPIVTFANSDGVPKDYYLFGDRQEPYDATIHRELHVTDQTGLFVKDTYILSVIRSAASQPPTFVSTSIVDQLADKADAVEETNTDGDTSVVQDTIHQD